MVRIPFGDVSDRINAGKKGLDHFRIEVGAGADLELLQDRSFFPPLLVDPLGAQRVVYIGQRNEPAEQGDLLPFFGPGRAVAVLEAGLPAAIAKKMNEDANKVMAMADVQERLEAYGAEDGGGSPERFAQFISSEIAQWRKVVKEGNVKGDS